MHMYNDGCEYKMFCPGIIPITSFCMFYSANKAREVLLVIASNRQKMLASNISKKKNILM